MSEIFNQSKSRRQAILHNDQDNIIHQIRQIKAESRLKKLMIAQSHLNKLYEHNLKTNFSHMITQQKNNKFSSTIETQSKQISCMQAKQLNKDFEVKESNLLKNTISFKQTPKNYNKIQIVNTNNSCQKILPKTQREAIALKYSGIQIVSSLIQNKLHQLGFVLLFQISKESAKQKQKQKQISKATKRLYIPNYSQREQIVNKQKYSLFSSIQSMDDKSLIRNQTLNSFDIIMKRKYHLNKQKIKEAQLNRMTILLNKIYQQHYHEFKKQISLKQFVKAKRVKTVRFNLEQVNNQSDIRQQELFQRRNNENQESRQQENQRKFNICVKKNMPNINQLLICAIVFQFLVIICLLNVSNN